eukprot:Hpha_TRINITY_DN16360_c1_g1::TRINITY_DN16360_c1_g1_i1::g.58245::m.58245
MSRGASLWQLRAVAVCLACTSCHATSAPVAPATPSPPVPPPPEDGNNNILIIVILAVVLLLIFIGVLFWWYAFHTNPNRRPNLTENELRQDPLDGSLKNKGAFMTTEPGRTDEDWQSARRQSDVEDEVHSQRGIEAPLEDIPREALPVGPSEFGESDMSASWKFQAKEKLQQLRTGDEFHDGKARKAQEERIRSAQERDLQHRKEVFELAQQKLLAGLEGDEVDSAVGKWKEVQDTVPPADPMEGSTRDGSPRKGGIGRGQGPPKGNAANPPPQGFRGSGSSSRPARSFLPADQGASGLPSEVSASGVAPLSSTLPSALPPGSRRDDSPLRGRSASDTPLSATGTSVGPRPPKKSGKPLVFASQQPDRKEDLSIPLLSSSTFS